MLGLKLNHVSKRGHRKESMATYFKQRCSKNDKTFWDTIAPFFTDKRNKNANDIVLKDGDDVVSDPAKVTEIFNTYFSNVASTIGFEDEIVSVEDALQKHSQHPSVLKIKMNTPELPVFNFHLLKVSDVESKLKNIDVKKATGYDKIPGKLLSKAYRELSVPMTNVLNTCISRSEFPAVLKCAELNPIYKKKDNLAEENYRPVSVLTAFCKIYESSLNDQLLQHFITIFNDFLSAYRKGYSCQSLLVKVIDDWKKSLDNNHIVWAVFMDLSKAFDSLSHSLPISLLNAYGLSISACNLMASYLQDRKQRVKLVPVRSTWSNLTKGVPRVSILGPVLFNVFMNDLFYFIKKCSLYNYADDNSMSNASAKIDEVMLNLKLDSKIAITWFIDNGMEPHPEKFQFMVMSNNVIDTHTLELDDTTRLRSQSDVVLLGNKIWIHTNSNLCFYCGRAPIYFPRINVICDMLNRDQIPPGRSEEYIHIHICFYYFYVNLYEYDVYILWCYICCMYASVWFVPGWARYPSLVGCKAQFDAYPGNATTFFYIFVS